jgi:hypothetical protein
VADERRDDRSPPDVLNRPERPHHGRGDRHIVALQQVAKGPTRGSTPARAAAHHVNARLEPLIRTGAG